MILDFGFWILDWLFVLHPAPFDFQTLDFGLTTTRRGATGSVSQIARQVEFAGAVNFRRRFFGQQFIKNHAQRINVAQSRNRLTAYLF